MCMLVSSLEMAAYIPALPPFDIHAESASLQARRPTFKNIGAKLRSGCHRHSYAYASAASAFAKFKLFDFDLVRFFYAASGRIG